MNKLLVGLVLAGSLIMCGSASAQVQTTPEGMIDGRQHPEQISDAAGYGFVLSHLSDVLADPKINLQTKIAFLSEINLSQQDELALRDILANHKVRRDAAIAKYNKSVEDGKVQGLPVSSFSSTHKAIVAQTRANLLRGLTADGLARLDAYVQNEKKLMRIAVAVN